MDLSFGDVSKREVRDAARLAIQSAVAAAATFSIMQAFGLPEKFLGVIAAVLVVQPTTGGTLSEGKDRVLATLVGSLIGVVSLILLPGGYGTAAALFVSMLVMNAIAGFRPEWRYGVVAAIALAVGSDQNPMQAALDRSIAFALGAAIGILTALIIWRESARRRAVKHLKEALSACADFLDAVGQQVEGADAQAGAEDAKSRYRSNISRAREAAGQVRFGHNEKLLQRIDATEQLWAGTRFLDQVGQEDDPGKADDLRQHVDVIRERAGSAARALAGDERPDNADYEAIEDAVKKARHAVATDHQARDFRQTTRGALVFALGEVAAALGSHRDLIGQGS